MISQVSYGLNPRLFPTCTLPSIAALENHLRCAALLVLLVQVAEMIPSI